MFALRRALERQARSVVRPGGRGTVVRGKKKKAAAVKKKKRTREVSAVEEVSQESVGGAAMQGEMVDHSWYHLEVNSDGSSLPGLVYNVPLYPRTMYGVSKLDGATAALWQKPEADRIVSTADEAAAKGLRDKYDLD